MAAISAAIIAASATLTTAFLTQFLAERYRRFNEATAVAAGLLGELNSYAGGYELAHAGVANIRQAIDSGRREVVYLRPFESPNDRFFDSVVGKLGLLGPDLAERVMYIYANLQAFRMSFAMVSTHHGDMSDDELSLRLEQIQMAMERAATEMENTLPLLAKRTAERFRFFSIQ